MLPFKKEDNERKYVCFVCGKKYSEFEEFKVHIVNSHDEGREFVLCPLPHCESPVRDLAAHFKAKHRDIPLPKIKQMKAMLWKDFTPKGKLKTKKPGFRNGVHISQKNHGKEFTYKSGMECEVFELLEEVKEVIAYDYEPFKSGIPYVFEGKEHHYFPDLSLQFEDGHVEIWEVKPTNQTELDVNQAKWSAAKAYCEARGWSFMVLTEIGIDKLKAKIRLDRALS